MALHPDFPDSPHAILDPAETKGREDLDVPKKIERLRQWCEDLNAVQSAVTYDFVYVDEEGFKNYRPRPFAELLTGFREYKNL